MKLFHFARWHLWIWRILSLGLTVASVMFGISWIRTLQGSHEPVIAIIGVLVGLLIIYVSWTEKPTFEKAVDVLKSFVEIVAILAAGLWAYNKFMSTEAPALKRNTRMESALTWKELESRSHCLAQVQVQVTNRSKSEITVGKVVRRAWFVDRPKTDKGIVYFDAMEPWPPNPIDDTPYLEGPLAFMYPPDAVNRHTFSWFVENKADSYALFRIELYENEKAVKPLDFIYEWGRPCELESPQKKEGER